MWAGQKTDITESAIASVFEWFMGNMEGKQEYSIAYPNTGFAWYDIRGRDKTDDEIQEQWCSENIKH